MDWISPARIAVWVLVGVFVVVFGLIRRESSTVPALNTAGVVLFVTGLAWASSVGNGEAIAAAGAASLGAIPFTMAS